MKLEKSYLEIHQFLTQHKWLLDREILERWPNFKSPYLSWANDLNQMSLSNICQLENTLVHEKISNVDYLNFLSKIKELQVLSQYEAKDNDLPKNLLDKISLKKRHEIAIIKSQLDKSEDFIDIGSGAGHLSSILLYQNEKRSLCIDQNKDFQEIGIKKLSKRFPDIAKRIQFENQTFNKSAKVEGIKNSTLLGLHACGNLSVDIAKLMLDQRAKEFLNYGCCYHKLSSSHLNLSKIAKENPFDFTNHALTIAAKSYKWMTAKDLARKYQVKQFRYTLHLFLKESCQKGFESIGNALSSEYQGTFSSYAKKYAKSSLQNTTEKELDEYYQSPKAQEQVTTMLLLGTIRSHLARLVELLIILDRALWLEENGLQVELLETFDRKLSPRNISLRASPISACAASIP